jgi:hypothetical protein
MRPGEKLLILRKYGGLGDILISSMIFPMLADQYPDIRVTYSCPRIYHPLFEGSALALSPYEEVFSGESHFHRGEVRPELLKTYDLIEDISIPCHIWETLFNTYGGSTVAGGNGFRWRNRLNMWCQWFGLPIRNPRTNIVIQEAERKVARQRVTKLVGSGKPTCLIAPFSGNSVKSYPWFLAVADGMRAAGWGVALLHPEVVPTNIPTLANLPFRDMGAACAVADLIIAVDSSALHWGGILGRPTLGIFNVNDGATYARYYPTVRVAQLCQTPCLFKRYHPAEGFCSQHTGEPTPIFPGRGFGFSRCYPSSSVQQILQAAQAIQPTGRG